MTTKQTFWRTFAITVATLLTMPASLWADSAFGGGSGFHDDPYIISTPEHWLQIANDVNNGNSYNSKYFELTSNLDFSGIEYQMIGWFSAKPFNGIIHGNGHMIDNVVIDKSATNQLLVGLFGYIGRHGSISNIVVGPNCVFKGTTHVGSIAETCDGRIYNCVNMADVSGTRTVGGICARLGYVGDVQNCTNMGDVTGSAYVGGFVAEAAAGGLITGCLMLGQVTADYGYNTIVALYSETIDHLKIFKYVYSNYYAGDCDGENLSGDYTSEMITRGYKISGAGGVTVKKNMDSGFGMTYNDTVYAGANQGTELFLSVNGRILKANAELWVSGGKLRYKGSDTWVLTIPAQDVVICLKLIGDVNCDGKVNVDDVTTLVDALLSSTASAIPNGDCDSDGEVNVNDVTTLIDTLLNSN